jgi:hypothetical protein
MLENESVRTGLLTEQEFVADYGAAQAVPGPLFTFAAYIGAARAARGGAVSPGLDVGGSEPIDLAVAAAAFACLMLWRWPSWLTVAACAAAGWMIQA